MRKAARAKEGEARGEKQSVMQRKAEMKLILEGKP